MNAHDPASDNGPVVHFALKWSRWPQSLLLATISLAGIGAIAATLHRVHAADTPGSAGTPGAPGTSVGSGASAVGTVRLPDGRENHAQARFDNLIFTPIAGWKKRGQEWGGEYTFEGPNFDKSRVQITARLCVPLDDKGLKGLAEKQTERDRKFIDFKQEAPPIEGTHPAGYKMLTTFTSVSSPGYGKDARLYMTYVYLESSGVGTTLHYAGAYRENYDKYKPVFDDHVKNLRLLSDQVLAPAFGHFGLMEQFSVNQCCDFIEWLINVPLTDTQRLAVREHVVDIWNRQDKQEAEAFFEIFKARNELDKLPKEKKQLAREAAAAEVIKEWRAEAKKGDKIARTMLEVYDQAHKPLITGKDGSLTRQQTDATLEILHFMASKVAGFDAGPSAQQKSQFADDLVKKYGTLDADTKKEIEQMPLYWAWLRAAWPELPADDRTKLVQAWGKTEQLQPIIKQIQEAKAKAIASGNHDPMAFTDAMRKLQQQQQTTAMISNMMASQHRMRMTVINNIGSSNTRYEYKYVYRYR